MKLPRRLLLILVLGLLAGGLPAQVDVRAELERSRILIGDQVRLRVLIAHDPAVSVTGVGWPALSEAAPVEVLQAGSLDTVPARNGEVLLQQELLLTSFDTGYHRLPPLPVAYRVGPRRDTAYSADLALTVATFPVQGDTATLAPIKPILEEPLALQDVLPYAAGLAGLLLLGGLAYVILKRRQRSPAPVVEADPRPAHEIALAALDTLRERQLWQRGELKAYYSELTRILRAFLERRYRVPALESTTAETAALLRQVDQGADWKEDLLRLFRTADAVKFAKARPPAETHQPNWERAAALVREAIPPPEPEASPDPTAGISPAKNPG